MVLWKGLEGGELKARLKWLTSGVAKKKKKCHHRVNVNRVGRCGCQLKSVVVCYASSILHGLSVNLMM